MPGEVNWKFDFSKPGPKTPKEPSAKEREEGTYRLCARCGRWKFHGDVRKRLDPQGEVVYYCVTPCKPRVYDD